VAWEPSPFHHISDPKRAATWNTCCLSPPAFSGERPTCSTSLRSLFCPFLASLSLTSWRSFRVSCASSQPNHRVACLLKWTVFPSTLMPRAFVRWSFSSCSGQRLRFYRCRKLSPPRDVILSSMDGHSQNCRLLIQPAWPAAVSDRYVPKETCVGIRLGHLWPLYIGSLSRSAHSHP